MAGKMCFGSDYNNAGAGHLRSSKAFCEGALYRAGGTALERPITDDPHVSGSDASDAWSAGWTLADDAKDDDPGGTWDNSATCCSAIPPVVT